MPAPAIQIENLTKDFHIGLRGVKLRAVEKLNRPQQIGRAHV